MWIVRDFGCENDIIGFLHIQDTIFFYNIFWVWQFLKMNNGYKGGY